MRTTIRLDDDLLREAKRLAAQRDTTLTSLIEDALRQALRQARAPVTHDRIDLPAFDGGRPQPGVDLDDGAALLELMEGSEWSS